MAVLANPSPAFEAWLRETKAAPGYRLMKELKQYWLVRLLRAAIKENSPQAYSELLEGWLIRLGVEPPKGVLLLSFAITPSARNKLTSQRMKANNRDTCQPFFCL